MIQPYSAFVQLETFYWDNIDNPEPLVNSFCIAFTKLVGGSEDVGDLNQFYHDEFEKFVSDFENIENEEYTKMEFDELSVTDKTIKKISKKYSFEKIFSFLNNLAYLQGMYDSLREVKDND